MGTGGGASPSRLAAEAKNFSFLHFAHNLTFELSYYILKYKKLVQSTKGLFSSSLLGCNESQSLPMQTESERRCQLKSLRS